MTGRQPTAGHRFEVRCCTDDDLDVLVGRSSFRDGARHRQQFEMSRQGTAEFFVAWCDGAPCGAVTVLHQSKYRTVRDRYGDFPELNVLSAFPTGQGIGSSIITVAETWVSGRGATRIGLAVEQANQAAFRLYTRLGYVDWGHGPVVDRWVEPDAAGRFRCHTDSCFYLVKTLSRVG